MLNTTHDNSGEPSHRGRLDNNRPCNSERDDECSSENWPVRFHDCTFWEEEEEGGTSSRRSPPTLEKEVASYEKVVGESDAVMEFGGDKVPSNFESPPSSSLKRELRRAAKRERRLSTKSRRRSTKRSSKKRGSSVVDSSAP